MAKLATMVKNQYGEKLIKIAFSYETAVIFKVRNLIGSRYFPERKIWIAPLYVETLNKLSAMGFTLDKRLHQFIKQSKQKATNLTIKKIKGLKGEPFPYQYAGISFIEQHHGRALVADEMGLGKTLQALAWCQMHRNKVPVLIITPASLKLNWVNELELWLPNVHYEILSGKKTWTPTADFIIINYDILPSWVDTIKDLNVQVMITDECHYYKNNSSKRTKAVKKIGKNIPHIIALSGTPIVNRPIEAFNAINLINPEIFPSFIDYTRRYCNAKYNGYGWDFNGASNTQELHEILSGTLMIRRLKKDVLKDLPEKLYSFVPLELSKEGKEEYTMAENMFIDYLSENYGEERAIKAVNAEVLVQYAELKKLAVKGCLKESIAWIKDFLDVDGKLVVFATHKFVIEELMKEFGNVAVKIDGSVSIENRQKAIDKFQNDDSCRLFVGNIKAAGVGITLTASSNVAFLELPWTPGELRQAIDRVHRIGQKNCVNVHYLFAINTIMDKIARLIDQKQKIIDSVLDGKDIDNQDLMLYEILKSYETSR
jgi:SWI/SNF-related matrix-associated actin-dependent regulator 1 of chromatin subfamily A